VEKGTAQDDKPKGDLKPLYARSVVNSLSAGMAGPFMGDYAVKLGASSSDMGWFQSSINLSNNLMQVFWGRLSDKLKRRIPFIIFGGLIIAGMWIPMMFVSHPSQLIVLLVFQALLGSMAVPAWTALIGDLVPGARLGRASASINLWASVGGLLATLGSGALMVVMGGSPQNMFLVPFIVASVTGVASSFLMLYVREKKQNQRLSFKEGIMPNLIEIFAEARGNRNFMRYCGVMSVFMFFMSICWPLFAITRIDVLKASFLQIALVSVAGSFVTIVFQGWAGRLSDSVGRKPLLLIFRFSLITVPLAYAFAPDMNTLIVVSGIWGIFTALGQACETAYLIDISPEQHRGSFTALFNLIMGVTSFCGSLLGGYLAQYASSLFGLVAGLQVVYMISMVGRGIGAAAHFKLTETLEKSK